MKVELVDTRDKPVDSGFRGFVIYLTDGQGVVEREFFAPAERFKAESRHAELLTIHSRARQQELALEPPEPTPAAQDPERYPDWASIARAGKTPSAPPPPDKAERRAEASRKRKADREALAKLSRPGRVFDADLYDCQQTIYPQITLHIVNQTPTLIVYVPGLRGERLRLPVHMSGDTYQEIWELALDYLYQHAPTHPGRRQPAPCESQFELLVVEMQAAGEPISERVTDGLYPAMRALRAKPP